MVAPAAQNRVARSLEDVCRVRCGILDQRIDRRPGDEWDSESKNVGGREAQNRRRVPQALALRKLPDRIVVVQPHMFLAFASRREGNTSINSLTDDPGDGPLTRGERPVVSVQQPDRRRASNPRPLPLRGASTPGRRSSPRCPYRAPVVGREFGTPAFRRGDPGAF